ncbi:MAG: pyrroline-5-carboxylate reductase [Candidatus Lokiarchaeota archaeon]|nr:pyrroline-5-carboxylate reductase [Candidatus Lokiarchaeota archaeon]
MIMFEKELGIIGVGKIGSALLNRLILTKTIDVNGIIIYDIDENKSEEKAIELGVKLAKDNQELVRNSKHILIAVIPQVIDEVLAEVGPLIKEDQIIISLAAGISFEHITKFLNGNVGLVRVMTNTPALIGSAATAIAHNKYVKQEQLEFIKKIFKAVGIVVELEENHLDAVTGLSGSGPAYIFIIIDALADGGVKMGLSREISLKLAAQTVMGSAKLLLDTKKHPGELKDMVATPAGTTITAIHELESAKIRATLIRAVEAATLKSKSLNSSNE